MATDIAFAIGVLSLLGSKVPLSLKIFLTALAVIDDLGAIIIIATFYTKSLNLIYLTCSLVVFTLLLALKKQKVRSIWVYILFGFIMWGFMLGSGIHATIAGVLLALTIPSSNEQKTNQSIYISGLLKYPVAYLILPVFALANTCINIQHVGLDSLVHQPSSHGIAFGLVVGKPLGIFTFSYLAVRGSFCSLPKDISWVQLLGAGVLGGIGFTISIFITLLAFSNSAVIDNAKIVILFSSLISACVGFLFLKITLKE
jgi:NhaA family Na+:H+ antiporter